MFTVLQSYGLVFTVLQSYGLLFTVLQCCHDVLFNRNGLSNETVLSESRRAVSSADETGVQFRSTGWLETRSHGLFTLGDELARLRLRKLQTTHRPAASLSAAARPQFGTR